MKELKLFLHSDTERQNSNVHKNLVENVVVGARWHAIDAGIAAHGSACPSSKANAILGKIGVPQIEVANVERAIWATVLHRIGIVVLQSRHHPQVRAVAITALLTAAHIVGSILSRQQWICIKMR